MSKKISIQHQFEVFASIDNLPPIWKTLVENAVEASMNAYAPYSRFQVGAALLLENGMIITGNNQENAAYPSGLCAERVALFNAFSTHPNLAVHKIAIVAHPEESATLAMAPPCGSCRQVISEYENKGGHPIQIMFMGPGHEFYLCQSINQLLPFGFGSDNLEGN